nr:hypothetical protein [Rhodanobacter thiooxydans]
MHALRVDYAPAGRFRIWHGAFQFGGDATLEALERRLAQQALADAGQQGGLGDRARHAHTRRAGCLPAILVRAAAITVAVDDHHRPAAVAAAQDAAQQVPRGTARACALGCVCALRLGLFHASLRRLPQCRRDDGQLRVLRGDPFGRRTVLAHAPAGVRVLDPLASVPHLPARIDRVGQDADPALHVPIDGRHRPGARTCRRYAVAVQSIGNGARTVAGEVFGEDPPHDDRLALVDGALANLGHAVAVGQTARAGARESASREASMRLVRQVGEVQLGHQAAQADIELVTLATGVDAVAHAQQADALKAQLLDRLRDVDAVAAQA